MELSVEEISKLVNGRIEGNNNIKVNNLTSVDKAGSSSLTFLVHPKYFKLLESTKASAILVNQSFEREKAKDKTFIVVEDVYHALSILLEQLHPNPNLENKEGISEQASVDPSATIGKNVYAGAYAYIDKDVKIGNNVKIFPHTFIGPGTVIGDNTIIYPGVHIYANTEIGTDCVLHAGCIIGSDGFGFVPGSDGSFRKIPQTGRVILGNHVEVGSNTTIDRATLESTVIKDGVKIDNLVQIAHNVMIGENTVIAAQAGISGSTKVGRNVQIGGQVGLVGHINLADGTKIGAKSGVSRDIKAPGQQWQGIPAEPNRLALRKHAVAKNLPAMQEKIHELEEQVAELKKVLQEQNKTDSI